MIAGIPSRVSSTQVALDRRCRRARPRGASRFVAPASRVIWPMPVARASSQPRVRVERRRRRRARTTRPSRAGRPSPRASSGRAGRATRASIGSGSRRGSGRAIVVISPSPHRPSGRRRCGARRRRRRPPPGSIATHREREDPRHVGAVLGREVHDPERQGPLVRAVEQDQRQEERVPGRDDRQDADGGQRRAGTAAAGPARRSRTCRSRRSGPRPRARPGCSGRTAAG